MAVKTRLRSRQSSGTYQVPLLMSKDMHERLKQIQKELGHLNLTELLREIMRTFICDYDYTKRRDEEAQKIIENQQEIMDRLSELEALVVPKG